MKSLIRQTRLNFTSHIVKVKLKFISVWCIDAQLFTSHIVKVKQAALSEVAAWSADFTSHIVKVKPLELMPLL